MNEGRPSVEGTSEIQRLLRTALDEEERRLVALEERVNNLVGRPDTTLPALPPAGGLDEPIDPGPITFSDTAQWRLQEEQEEQSPPAFTEPRPSGFLSPQAVVEPLEPPELFSDEPAPAPTTGFREENEQPLSERPTTGFDEGEIKPVETGFRDPPTVDEIEPRDPTLLRRDLAHLEASVLLDPTPVEPSEYPTVTGYHPPVEIVPLEDPSPSGFHRPVPIAEPLDGPVETGFRDPPTDHSQTVVPLEEARPSGFAHLERQLAAVPRPAPPDEREFRDPVELSLPSEAPQPAGFASSSGPDSPASDVFSDATEVFESFAPPPPPSAELDSARQLIAESGAHLRALEETLTALESESRAPQEPLQPSGSRYHGPKSSARKRVDTDRFELRRAFAEGDEAPDWRTVLSGQQELRDRIEVMQDATAEREAQLVGRAERAERACADSLAKVMALTARTEALANAVTHLTAEVANGQAAQQPAPAGTTQQLLDLLRTGAVRRPALTEPFGSGDYARSDPLRERLLRTVSEHQGLLRDHARLLDHLVRLLGDR